MKKLRAVLVEESPAQARALARAMEADGDIIVVAMPSDTDTAVEEVARRRPDVVTMDLELRGGGGQAAIERIMAEDPTPILVLSGAVDGDDTAAVRALAAGAVDALPKPRAWTASDATDLRRQVRRVAAVPVIRRRPRRPVSAATSRPRVEHSGPVVAIAASTGGPAALATVLAGLDGLGAPVLVVQHIHPSFASGFAAWLASATGRAARIAENGEPARAGMIYIAPGERHLRLAANRCLQITDEPRTLHRPSADVLFDSLAEQAGSAAVGVVLTGMGEDGVRGLRAVRAAGGRALAQDRDTSAVFGMPRAAQEAGATDEVLPLDRLAGAIRVAVEQRC